MNAKKMIALQIKNAEHYKKSALVAFNTPNAYVRATVFSGVFTTDFKTYTDVLVKLDNKGIHGTFLLDGVTYPLTRLNSHLDALIVSYAFDIKE